jgi:hypothetical protein
MPESVDRSMRAGAWRAAALLFTLSALGEIGVGAAALVYPQLIALLMDAPLESGGLLVARMLGSAVLALGLTWWLARNDPQGPSRCRVGFLVYNVALGVLFALHALQAARPALPWLVGIAHLSIAAAFALASFSARAATAATSNHD